jgi:hypothetical protein
MLTERVSRIGQTLEWITGTMRLLALALVNSVSVTRKMQKEKAMTRVKRIVTTACTASLLLGWTGISNIQLLIPFRSAGASVLLAQQNNPKASYNQGYQLGRKDAKHGQNSDNRQQRNESSQWNSEFRRGYEDGYAGRSRNDGTYDSQLRSV